MRNALWSLLDAAAAPVSSLVIMAGLVHALSPHDYGALVVALAASGLSMAVNPAIAGTTTKFVAEFRGRQGADENSVAGTITTSLLIVAVVDVVLFLLIGIFVKPVTHWVFGTAAVGGWPAEGVLMLSMLTVGLQQLDVVIAAAIRGLERFRRQALIEVMARILAAAVVVFVAWSTKSIAAILVALGATVAGILLVRGLLLRRLLPGRRLLQRARTANVVAFLQYGGWMWLNAIAGVAYLNVDRIVVGRMLGASAAGHYNIYLQLTQLIHFIPSSLLAFSLPELSRLGVENGNQTRERIIHAYSRYLVAAIGAALVAAVLMLACWPFILAAFAAEGRQSNLYGTSGILILNFVLLACNVAPYYLLLALGESRSVSLITTVSMLASLVLMAVLIPRFGMQGAAAARLAYGVGALFLFSRANRVLRARFK